jgi:hypothetical protein
VGNLNKACILLLNVFVACWASKTSVIPAESKGFTLVNVLENEDGLSTLRVDKSGLHFLRSDGLRDTPLRIIGIVGPARTGKSFFLNSLLKTKAFEASSGDEGHTKVAAVFPLTNC